MSATKFSLYQDALRHLADSRLVLITDDQESRYALDDAYAEGVAYVLRQAAWRFALHTDALIPGPSGSGSAPGFSTFYAKPADWLRTHAIFILAADLTERPIDVREQALIFSANVASGVYLRFISSSYADPETAGNPWPEHFAQAVSAYLAFLVAERVTGEKGAAARMSQLFSSLLANAVAHDALPENIWLADQLDGSFVRVAGAMVDQGFFRFAMKTLQITNPTGTADGGFSYAYAIPADWSRTRSLYVLSAAGQRRPFDAREEAGEWQANVTSFYAQYVSHTLAMQTQNWPDHYLRAVQRALEFDRATREGDKDQADDFKAYEAALGDALDGEADDADPWLQHQLSGAYGRAMPAVIARGWWRFALKTVQLNAATDQEATVDAGGYPYSFVLPADWVRTHAAFVNWNSTECPFDLKEHEGQWFTAVSVFLARYLSTAAYDATLWPQSLAKAVLAYLEFDEGAPAAGEPKGGRENPQSAAAMWQAAIDAALEEASDPPHPWLRFQLNGSFLRYARWLGEQARWRFAIRTIALESVNDPLPGDDVLQVTNPPITTGGTIDFPDGNPMDAGSLVAVSGAPDNPTAIGNNYGYRFVKPNDWLRTIWFGREINSGIAAVRLDVDYIDEGLVLFANFSPLTLRYISVEKLLDATQWTAHFHDALLAMLEHIEARSNPKLAGLAAERMKFYIAQLKEAEANDDERDGPAYQAIGRIVHSRQRWYGSGGIGPGYGPSQGWYGS